MRAKGVVVGIATALLLGGTAFWAPTMAEAAVVRGSAAIVNGDLDKARREAKEDAMRNCIE